MKLRIHWNLFKRRFTLHSYKSCIYPDVLYVTGPWIAELKPLKKSNPRGFVLISSEDILIDPNPSILNSLVKTKRLIYNKQEISFNIHQGNGLLCDNTGCWLIEKK